MSAQPQPEKRGIYDAVTDAMIKSLEQGIIPWRKPWAGGDSFVRPLRANNLPYNGGNVLALFFAAIENGYSSRYWMTYNQAVEFKAQVRKGEKGTQILFYKTLQKEEKQADGSKRIAYIPIPRIYTVFNANQIDGLDARFFPPPPAPRVVGDRIPEVDAFIGATGATIKHGMTSAYYATTGDYVGMPEFVSFDTAGDYYATMFHELSHWTEHKSRLDDPFKAKFEADAYAMNELKAELACAFLCSDFNVRHSSHASSEAYIGSWISRFKRDPKALFTAASQAEKSVAWLYGKNKAAEAEETEQAA